ncbi:hypothetical protein, partial [Burkholderia cepacia]|uniref:hypothetical protein n=1 Tax=Burkholderia cepacia TaxID=292 RepID=UPI001E313EB0
RESGHFYVAQSGHFNLATTTDHDDNDDYVNSRKLMKFSVVTTAASCQPCVAKVSTACVKSVKRSSSASPLFLTMPGNSADDAGVSKTAPTIWRSSISTRSSTTAHRYSSSLISSDA